MKYNKFKWMLIAFSITILFSCESQQLEIPNPNSYSKVYLTDGQNSPIEYQYEMKDEVHSIPLGAGYGGFLNLDEDITVGLKFDPELINDFNTSNQTNYPLISEESFTLSSNTVVLPAGGTNSNSINIEINPSKLLGPSEFLLPISIENVTGNVFVNDDLKTVYYLISGFYDENPFEYFSRDKWTVHDYSSDENDSGGGRAHHAIDGNMETFWHSRWRRDPDGNRPGHPHFLAFDMNEVKTIHGLEIFGRTNKVGADGNPKNIYVELSIDGEEWIMTKSYVLDNISSNIIYFPTAMNARYFKMTIDESHTGVYRSHIAEIEAF